MIDRIFNKNINYQLNINHVSILNIYYSNNVYNLVSNRTKHLYIK